MAEPNEETKPETPKFDFSAYPPNTLFHERRTGFDRRKTAPKKGDDAATPTEPATPREPRVPRVRKDRRRRIDPTTFEKQYTDDELEFMSAVQKFKVQSGKTFPTYGDVLKVAAALGYRKAVWEDADETTDAEAAKPAPIGPESIPRG